MKRTMNSADNLESIKGDISEDTSTAVGQGVARCLIAAKRMKTPINSILDLARMEDAKMPLDNGPHAWKAWLTARL